LDVSGGGQLPVRLAAGQAASLSGALTLTPTGGQPATYVAATIGPEAPAPPAPPTGTILMHGLGCPQTTLEAARAAGFAGPALASCVPLALDPPPALTLANGNALAPDRADPATATYGWTGLLYSPFPVANLTPPTNFSDFVLVGANGAIVKASDPAVAPTVANPGAILVSATDPNPTTTLYFFAGGTGSLSLAAYLCPAGMTFEHLVAADCQLANGGVAAQITGARDGVVHDQTAATSQPPNVVWSNLPFDAYVIQFPQLPAGFANYTIPGASFDQSSQTFSATVSADAPNPKLAVYFLAPPGTPTPTAGTGTGTVTVRIFDCPAGMTRANFAPGQCGPTSGTSVRLVLDDGTTRSGNTATIAGNVVAWANVPSGKQRLEVFGVPPGFVDTVAPGLDELGANPPTFALPLSAAAPSADVSVYNFVPAGAASPAP
ncbi:MAG TPA: hypothetical protein VFQ80_15360, partial [Thermomicrobiales bacterium]|nr:hypothetical protein [Thermomicrobiales bacterium]